MQRALSSAAMHTCTYLHEDEPREDNTTHTHGPTPTVNDIVAVVEHTSSRTNPKIILGKILRVFKREALLAWLKPRKRNGKTGYRMVVGTDTWKESFEALIYPIDIVWDDTEHMYFLHSDPRKIHDALDLD